MTNCPTCGADKIVLQRETNVDWGRAVAGWALFGMVGGAVGAVTGDDRNVNTCLNCGTQWKAQVLYGKLQTIYKLTGRNLDLSKAGHRHYYENFINSIEPELIGLATNIKLLERDFRAKLKGMESAKPPSEWLPGVFWILCFLFVFTRLFELALIMAIFSFLTYLCCLIFLNKFWYEQREEKGHILMTEEKQKLEQQVDQEKRRIVELAQIFDSRYQQALH